MEKNLTVWRKKNKVIQNDEFITNISQRKKRFGFKEPSSDFKMGK